MNNTLPVPTIDDCVGCNCSNSACPGFQILMDGEPAPAAPDLVSVYDNSHPFCRQVDNTHFNHVVGICFITLVALSTVVNTAIIVYFLAKKKYKLSHHMAYLNLAVADLCICIYGTAIRGPGIYDVVISTVICEISAYTGAFVTMVNFASILPITYDRLVAVVFPYRYKYRNHRGHLKYTFALIWTTPIAVLSIITLYAYTHNLTFAVYCPNNNVCLYDDWGKIYFIWFLSCFFYILPLLFNIISYSFIIKELKQKQYGISRTLLISLRAILICVVFTVSWVPHFTVHMTGHADDKQVMWISQVFLYLNSISDPLLYLFSLKAITPCIEKIKGTGKRGITINRSVSTVSPVPPRMRASTRRVLPDLPTSTTSTNG